MTLCDKGETVTLFRVSLTAVALALLAGCGDPLQDVERLGDVELAEEAEAAQAVEAPSAPDARPLFARLLTPKDAPEASAAPDGAAADAYEAPNTKDPVTEAAKQEQSAPQAPKKRGFFARLSAKENARAPQVSKSKPLESGAELVEAALTSGDDEPAKEPSTGLFSRKKAARLTGPDALEIAPGAQLPFGQIARVCALQRSELGKQVERSGGGKGKYRLYDSFPNSTGMRPFYITGFDDGCPRQVNAAMAIFGSAQQYEALRANKALSTGAADKAYDKARRQTCRAKVGKDCGAQARKLEKETAFLTVYDRFGTAQNWRDILLHDGAVLAMD